jgi:hypothetical protein
VGQVTWKNANGQQMVEHTSDIANSQDDRCHRDCAPLRLIVADRGVYDQSGRNVDDAITPWLGSIDTNLKDMD